MACNNCPCKEKIIRTTAVAVTGTSPNQFLTLTIPAVTLNENECFKLIICQTIPDTAGTLPVQILDGTTDIPVLNRIGNTMRADQLRTRKCYFAVYGADTPHVLIKNHVCETKATM